MEIREELTNQLKKGLIKDFNELYVNHFTTEWKMERFCRHTEIKIMSFDNSVDSIISLIVERIKGIENPYHYEHTGCDAFIMSGGFNSAIQKAVELFEEVRK